jgi:hypothetical protein
MEMNNLNPQEFYATQGQISDPDPYGSYLDALASDLPSLVRQVQGLMLHVHWSRNYGLTLNRIRKEEQQIRTTSDRLKKIFALHHAPLCEERPVSKRTVGTCRDFALFLTSILRHRGIPARARVGFGTYFTEERFEDHWVCEYWRQDDDRWVMVDSQLDEVQKEGLEIDFDPLDVPPGKFITGGQAWIKVRNKQADPYLFGIFNLSGFNFVKGNMVRDFLALNKIEILPWDNFGLIAISFRDMKPVEKRLTDRLAKISTGDDQDFILLRAAYVSHQERLLPSYFRST